MVELRTGTVTLHKIAEQIDVKTRTYKHGVRATTPPATTTGQRNPENRVYFPNRYVVNCASIRAS